MIVNIRLYQWAALAVCSVGAAGCNHGTSTAPPVTEVSSVAVVAPIKQSMKRSILQPAYTKAYEQTPIYSRVPGYVEKVPVDIGDEVKKGDPLAIQWVPELKQELISKTARADQADAVLRQTRAAFAAAKANVQTAKANVSEAFAAIARGEAEYARWEKEVKRNEKLRTNLVGDNQTIDEVVYQMKAAHAGWKQAEAKHLAAQAAATESEARRDKAEADIKAAEESKRVAEADRDQAKVWYDYATVRAPYDGIVTQRNIHPGAFLQASSSGSTNKSAEPLFNMVNMKKLRINVQIPEYDAALVKDGDEVAIAFQGLKDETISGKVTRATEALNEDARTLRVEIHIDNVRLPNGNWRFRPGMYGNAAIKVATQPVWTLPNGAVYTDGERSFCFIVDESSGHAMKTALQLGIKNDTLVEVLKKQSRSPENQLWEDFTGKERIVAANPESLLDGQAVTVSPKDAPAGKN